MKRLGIVLAVVTAVWGFVALWWWALLGTTEEVAFAHMLTVFVLGSAAAIMILEGE